MIRLFMFSLFLTGILYNNVRAQQKELTTQVTQIAGSVIYLSAGSDDGIVQGDTLYIYREKTLLGSLAVQSVASKSLSAEFASKPFALTRGQVISIRFEKPISTIAEPKQETNPQEPKTSIFNTTASSTKGRKSHKPQISGRISIGGTANMSTTKWNNVQNRHTNRMFVTPYTNVSALVSNLPGGLSVDASMAYSYRYSSYSNFTPASWARFYRMNVEKEFTGVPFSIKVGRFYNRYEIFSGFWDGVMAKIGDRNNGVGFIAGFEPIRSNEGFQTDLPKYSAYTYQEFQYKNFRSSTELDFTAVTPNINLDNHIFAGAYQQFLLGRNRISVRLQTDRHPQTKKWNFSQVMVRGAFQLTDAFELHGAFNRRRPYYIYSVDPLGYLRTQITGGARLRMNAGSIGGDLTRITSELSPTAYSVSGYAQTYRTRLWNLGFSINGQYWFNDNYNTLRLAPEINRDFNRLHLSLGYEFYRSDFISERYITHTADLSAMISLGPKWYFQTNWRTSYGQLFLNNTLQFSIWRSF